MNFPTDSIHASIAMDIFSLPRVARDDIYRRVLTLGHPIYLFQETGSSVVAIFAPDRPVYWLALLHTNQKVYHEARTILYRLNHFSFMDTTQRQATLAQSFLQRIGPVNAGHLSHVSINFPVVESLRAVQSDGKHSALGKDDLLSLQLLLEKCMSLMTLELRLYGENALALNKASQNIAGAKLIRDTFDQIDIQRKGIRSLSNFVVRVFNGLPAPEVVEHMKRLGWAVLPGH